MTIIELLKDFREKIAYQDKVLKTLQERAYIVVLEQGEKEDLLSERDQLRQQVIALSTELSAMKEGRHVHDFCIK